jgi:hypothetical protein
MRCVIVKKTWNKFKELKVRYVLLAKHSSWEDVLLGQLQPPLSEVTNEKEIEWDISKSCIITLLTPWDILKSFLLWFIWCH